MTVSTQDVRHESIAQMLDEARARTLLLIATLSEADLRAQHDPLMSPILWDLGHIVAFEELWLTENLDGVIRFSEMPGIFNPFEHPRRTRASLPLPSLAALKDEMRDVRERVLERLQRADLDSSHPLLRDGYVYHMVAQHEYQHNETILQTLQLKQGAPYSPFTRGSTNLAVHSALHPAAAVVDVRPDGVARSAQLSVPGRRLGISGIHARMPIPGEMVQVPAGAYPVGTHDRSIAYDNERPLHLVDVRAFSIDRAPVTNAEYLAFVESGGYSTRDYWTPEGWTWLVESKAAAPKHWMHVDDMWMTRFMDLEVPLPGDHPVVHICYHEASAYARFAGKRLPTEQEWEIAASWDPSAGDPRLYPWGSEPATADIANIDQLVFGTTPVGAHPRNVSPLGCIDMIGNVWEWTSSDFSGYPGFEAFPYPEYSEVFFGSEYKVLRGGSWATRPGAIRNTFRNWDYPIRRQIFAGVRCARDD